MQDSVPLAPLAALLPVWGDSSFKLMVTPLTLKKWRYCSDVILLMLVHNFSGLVMDVFTPVVVFFVCLFYYNSFSRETPKINSHQYIWNKDPPKVYQHCRKHKRALNITSGGNICSPNCSQILDSSSPSLLNSSALTSIVLSHLCGSHTVQFLMELSA